MIVTTTTRKPSRKTFVQRAAADLVKNRYVYIMLLPIVIYYLLFHYGPLAGVMIAFKQFSPGLGILRSPWVGFKHFIDFLTGPYFERTFFNTLSINVMSLVIGFPIPIILAILLDEVRHTVFRRTVQTITYLPHFISLVVICGMIKDFTGREGLINDIISFFNADHVGANLLSSKPLFQPIYVLSGIWQEVGWGTIIYLAALSAVDPALNDAVCIDGGNRFHRVWHISLPSIMPTIIILLILRIGAMTALGYEKIILLYNPSIYETSDVISSYVYRRGIVEMNYSFSSAVGLFSSVINLILVVSANWLSRTMTKESLW